jgi:cysteinyl-tRNA synthetase
MAAKHLGETFDIHGGGIDLQFPHHENERAQSCCAHHTDIMANVWMHNGYLMVEGEKMSKSLGNFITVRELFEGWAGHPWPGEAIRFNMLHTHFRHPIDWTSAGLDESHKILWKWAHDTKHIKAECMPAPRVISCLQDDLNTPEMIYELHKLYKNGKLQELKNSMVFLGFSLKIDALRRMHRLKAESITAAPPRVGQPESTGHSQQPSPSMANSKCRASPR